MNESLDTNTFQELLDNALEEWKQKSGNTVVYPSDVSYTLLEMMAMLVDMLHYYMDQQTDEHRQQYCSLWKQSNEDVKKSFPVQITTTHDLEYQKGMVLQGHIDVARIPLEIQMAGAISPTKMVAMYYQDKHHKQRIDMLLRQEEGAFTLPLRHEFGEIMILLDAPYQHKKTYAMYLSCNSAFEKTEEAPFSYATWDMMYYGTYGWQKAEILQDESEGFLYSGYIRFRIPDKMHSFSYDYGSVYAIKFILRKEAYDRLPCLRSIWLSVLEVRQQEHLTTVYDYNCKNKKDTLIVCDEILHNKQILGFKEDKRKPTLYHPIQVEKITTEQHFKLKFLGKYTYPVHIRVLALQEHPYEQIYKGVTSQKIKIENSFVEKLMIQTKQGYQEISCFHPRKHSNYGYGCWQDHDTLTFGNGRDFKIMEEGKILYENLIYYGNTKWDKHQKLMLENNVQVQQLDISDSHKQRQATAYETLITSEDIVRCVLQMPAITIQKAKVDKKTSYGYTLYIKNETNLYTKEYLAYINAYLEKRLLLGLNIHVQPFTTAYVILDIHCTKIDNPSGCIEHLKHYIEEDRKELEIDQLRKECRLFIPQAAMKQINLTVNSQVIKESRIEVGELFELKTCHIWDGRTHYE